MAAEADVDSGTRSSLRHRTDQSRFQYTGTPAGNEDHDHRDVDTKGEAKGGSSGRRRSPWLFLKEEWDTLAWIAGALAVTYYTDFWFMVLHGEAVDRLWLHVGAGMFVVATLLMVALFRWHPNLHYSNWKDEAPAGLFTATALFLLGGISVTASLWPVWGIFAPSILFVLFMAFISIISLL